MRYGGCWCLKAWELECCSRRGWEPVEHGREGEGSNSWYITTKPTTSCNWCALIKELKMWLWWGVPWLQMLTEGVTFSPVHWTPTKPAVAFSSQRAKCPGKGHLVTWGEKQTFTHHLENSNKTRVPSIPGRQSPWHGGCLRSPSFSGETEWLVLSRKWLTDASLILWKTAVSFLLKCSPCPFTVLTDGWILIIVCPHQSSWLSLSGEGRFLGGAQWPFPSQSTAKVITAL